MKKAYIILAHKNPDQLHALVDRLSDGKSEFFIHIDLKSPLYKERRILTEALSITLVDSISTAWGTMGLVQATLEAMKKIKMTGKQFEKIILLSGQDYPVKTNEEIDSFYQSSPHRIFLDFSILPNYTKWKTGGGSYRIEKYFFGYSFVEKYAARSLNFLASFLPFLKRRFDSVRHFYGSQWFTIDMYSLNFIVDYVAQNPDYLAFHQHTFAPDELFFQTILLNSGRPEILGGIVNDNKVFMMRENESDAHPKTLVSSDFERIVSSSALFARKFDPETDSLILQLIDQNCLQQKKIMKELPGNENAA